MLQTKHVDIIPPLLKTCMLQTKHTCQHEKKGESVVYRYSFSNPRTEVHCHQRLPACSLTHRYQFYSAESELSSISFSANLLTICIPSCVLPHLIYHICNLYRRLPLPSPSRVSASADGFCRPTLSMHVTWIHRSSEQCSRS